MCEEKLLSCVSKRTPLLGSQRVDMRSKLPVDSPPSGSASNSGGALIGGTDQVPPGSYSGSVPVGGADSSLGCRNAVGVIGPNLTEPLPSEESASRRRFNASICCD